MVPVLALAISRAHLTQLLSSFAFAVDFGDFNTSLMMTTWRAINLLRNFDPNSRVVSCQLRSDTAPKGFDGRVSDAEFKQLMEPLQLLISETRSNLTIQRTSILCMILFFPFLLIPPFGCILLSLIQGSFGGSKGKARNPVELKRQIGLLIDLINKALAPRGISLVNPCSPIWESTGAIIENFKDIEWVVS